jgi:hypothetical protein
VKTWDLRPDWGKSAEGSESMKIAICKKDLCEIRNLQLQIAKNLRLRLPGGARFSVN